MAFFRILGALVLFTTIGMAAPAPKEAKQQKQSLKSIWKTNSGKTIDIERMDIFLSQNRQILADASVQMHVTFPEESNASSLSVEIKSPQQTLHFNDLEPIDERPSTTDTLIFKVFRDGLDFEITVNAFGEMTIQVWSGYGRFEVRHALTDYRHSRCEATHQLNGATLKRVTPVFIESTYRFGGCSYLFPKE